MDYCFDPDFQRRLGDGGRWSLKLAYRGAALQDDVAALLAENHAFAGGDDVVVFHGPILPEPESLEELCADLEPVEPGAATADGLYIRREGRLMRSRLPQRRIGTLQAYFDLNFQLLRSPGRHVLPGYLVENGVLTGMNVEIRPGCKIAPPVLLCDNISLGKGCILEDGVIVGRNVAVDNGNYLKHTVVLGNTFVGKNMEFHDKILDSGRIIDPAAGEYIDLGDGGVAGDLRRYQKGINFTTLFECGLAAVLAIVGLIPFCLCRLLGLGRRSGLWYYKLSMDRYPKLWSAMRGKCALVRRGPRGDGVFRFSESLSIGRNRYQRLLDDIYFTHHRGPWLVLQTVLKAMINRMFTTRDAFQNTFELR